MCEPADVTVLLMHAGDGQDGTRHVSLLDPPVGREPGEQVLLRDLHRPADGAALTGPGPAASHPHADLQ